MALKQLLHIAETRFGHHYKVSAKAKICLLPWRDPSASIQLPSVQQVCASVEGFLKEELGWQRENAEYRTDKKYRTKFVTISRSKVRYPLLYWLSWYEECAGCLRAQIWFELYETEHYGSEKVKTFALVGPAKLLGNAEKLLASYVKEREYREIVMGQSTNDLKAKRVRNAMVERRRRKSAVNSGEDGFEKINEQPENKRQTNEVRETGLERRRGDPIMHSGGNARKNVRENDNEEVGRQPRDKRGAKDVHREGVTADLDRIQDLIEKICMPHIDEDGEREV